MNVEWELSQTLESDGQGIRAACILKGTDKDEYQILTGTQAGSMVLYGVPSGSLEIVPYQHNHAVTALVSYTADDDKEFYVSGCKDSVIRIFDASTHTLVHSLEGHEKAVTSLSFIKGNFLVSGSWDGTAKVWNLNNFSLVCTLGGHENTVSVCCFGATSNTVTICTGSAGIAQGNSISGHSIRLHQVNLSTGETRLLQKVTQDHDGPIRDVVASATMLASCSNDGTVRLRSHETGESLSTLMLMSDHQQHPPMLLSVAVVDESIAASAEDGHVAIWNAGQQQTLLRHASCVWKVVALPNGDLATCGEDGILRIFTTVPDRMAALEIRNQFADQVQQALAKQSQGPTSEEISKLPLWEMNAQKPGSSEGQVQVFNKGGIAIAAQWSDASKTWIEVGQVMGSADSSSQTIDGVQYDHVLPIEVDTESGQVAKLQIGYNNGENPFVAAQRFIDDHVLPQHHLAEIADYIRQRVGNSVPSLGEQTQAAPATMTPMLEHLPMKGYKTFELSAKNANTTMDKMVAKMKEFNASAETKIDESALESLVSILLETNRYHSSRVENEQLQVIITMLQNWSPEQAFPALDLARLTVLHPMAASNAAYWTQVFQLALGQVEKAANVEGTAAVAIPMLTLRLFANSFRGGPGSQQAVTEQMDRVLDMVDSLIATKNKNIRLSVATVLLNSASWLNATPSSTSSCGKRLVSAIAYIFEQGTYESEAMVRALVALGTALINNQDAKQEAKEKFLVSKVELAASPHGDKAKAVAKEIYSLLN